MKRIVLIVFIAFVTNAKAQTWVTIPDANFVTYLQGLIPAAMNGNQMNTSSTLVTTTTHTIAVGSGSGIINLFGVQYFTSLTDLECYSGSLTTLPALPNSLQYLSCPNNVLTTLPALPNSLIVLQCYYNSLTSLPALPNSLADLECQDNNITCFPTFPNSINFLGIDPNPYNCLPNYINWMDSAQLATPLCTTANTNSCTVASSCAPAARFTLNQDPAPQTWDVYPSYSANATSVRWYWGDGSSTIGLNPSHTYSVVGTYTICVASYSTCGDSSVYCQKDSNVVQVNVKTRATTGINQLGIKDEELRIYPNPTSAVLNVEGLMLNANSTLVISDMLGNTVKQIKVQNSGVPSGSFRIAVSDLSEGVYFLRVETNDGAVIKKIIKN